MEAHGCTGQLFTPLNKAIYNSEAKMIPSPMYPWNLMALLYGVKASFVQVSNLLFMCSKEEEPSATKCSLQFPFTPPHLVSLRPALPSSAEELCWQCANFWWIIDSRDPIGSKLICLETDKSPYAAL
ncbi:hypothetical protein GQ55_8G253200 [Panicum hallii var. hallii]|uniref:Uncharacterized protein n=1 Tax=Panicum hallii var. hallii TaxID=1504633 RepID=A0A2T7CR38_9POAL|nr:hypothetical protein GQ55_8G253200 [Panicum hallii var. hallii]